MLQERSSRARRSVSESHPSQPFGQQNGPAIDGPRSTPHVAFPGPSVTSSERALQHQEPYPWSRLPAPGARSIVLSGGVDGWGACRSTLMLPCSPRLCAKKVSRGRKCRFAKGPDFLALPLAAPAGRKDHCLLRPDWNGRNRSGHEEASAQRVLQQQSTRKVIAAGRIEL